MSKTYSVAIKTKSKYPDQADYWVTNWNEYSSLDSIDWDDVAEFVADHDDSIGYGYYYGHKSSDLSSGRCRTILYED